MKKPANLPGTNAHQQMLQTITEFYDDDERVLALLLFGSLSRGNWDQFSDLDLDIVMSDDAAIDARLELEKLCASIEQKHGTESLIIADSEEGDVVLGNLVQFSIRYHILRDTKPAILDSMCSLSGSLSLEVIREAANYEYKSEPKELAEWVNQYLRYVLELYNAIVRKRLWMAMEMLHRIQNVLMTMFVPDHAANRPIHYFDANASPKHNELLASLSPKADLKSVKDAFNSALQIPENHLEDFCKGYCELTTAQRHILDMLKHLQFKT